MSLIQDLITEFIYQPVIIQKVIQIMLTHKKDSILQLPQPPPQQNNNMLTTPSMPLMKTILREPAHPLPQQTSMPQQLCRRYAMQTNVDYYMQKAS
jgi:hypothetical protein